MSSQVVSIAQNAVSLKAGKQYAGYTKVILHVSDEVSYTVGNDNGLAMEYTMPFGTPQMAQDILDSISGYQYQEYDATDALIDPAVQLGDGLDVNGIYGSIDTKRTKFGYLFHADVGSPQIKQINQTYTYKSSQERQVERNFLSVYAKLSIQADQIAAEVEARKSDVETLNALLKVQADQIAAKVSQSGGDPKSFAWEMYSAYMRFLANNKEILRLDASGAVLSGIIIALGGKIGGFDIMSDYLSYNNQTWGGTNTTGAYLGRSGLQLGRNFSVDMQGRATMESADIRGTLRAGDLIYGGDAGYFDGSGIGSHTVAGNRLQYNTVSTSYTSGGINTSLGYADYANGVFNGWNTAANLKTGAKGLSIGGHTVQIASVSFRDGSGNTISLRYLTWI